MVTLGLTHTVAERIPPKLTKHCDFGHIQELTPGDAEDSSLFELTVK